SSTRKRSALRSRRNSWAVERPMTKQRTRRSKSNPLVGRTRAARALWAALSERQRKQLCARGNFIVHGKNGRSYRITGIKYRCCSDHPAAFHLEIEQLRVTRRWRATY